MASYINKTYKVVEIPVLKSPCVGCTGGGGICIVRDACTKLASFNRQCDQEVVSGFGTTNMEDQDGYSISYV